MWPLHNHLASPCPIQTFAGGGGLEAGKAQGRVCRIHFLATHLLSALRLHSAQPTLLQQAVASDSAVSMCRKGPCYPESCSQTAFTCTVSLDPHQNPMKSKLG